MTEQRGGEPQPKGIKLFLKEQQIDLAGESFTTTPVPIPAFGFARLHGDRFDRIYAGDHDVLTLRDGQIVTSDSSELDKNNGFILSVSTFPAQEDAVVICRILIPGIHDVLEGIMLHDEDEMDPDITRHFKIGSHWKRENSGDEKGKELFLPANTDILESMIFSFSGKADPSLS